jgi:hypothetical protein
MKFGNHLLSPACVNALPQKSIDSDTQDFRWHDAQARRHEEVHDVCQLYIRFARSDAQSHW